MMKRKLKTYLPFVNAGIQEVATYRVNWIFFMLGNAIACFVSYFIWAAVYSSGGEESMNGFTMPQMVVYIVLMFLTSTIIASDGAYVVGEEIRDGVAGFCDDKDCVAALKILRPAFVRAFATVTPSPRTLAADALAAKLREAGWRDVAAVPAWRDAIAAALDWAARENGGVIICGSLFLAGAACDHFGALPWKSGTVTPSEMLKQGGADNR